MQNRGMKMLLLGLATLLITIAVLSTVKPSSAEPTGPNNLTVIKVERKPYWGPQSLDVIAGNVTEITIFSESVTRRWAGVFGNISGTIVLMDANNNTLYDWSVASPQGEIYASRANALSWSSIRCANYSERAAEDVFLNASATEEDAPRYTFLNTTEQSRDGDHTGPGHPLFYVGSIQINASTCYAVKLYNSSRTYGNFTEVLLSDGTNLIYTALLAEDSDGFDGATHDFEMLLAENGYGTDTQTTTYYFWVEIE